MKEERANEACIVYIFILYLCNCLTVIYDFFEVLFSIWMFSLIGCERALVLDEGWQALEVEHVSLLGLLYDEQVQLLIYHLGILNSSSQCQSYSVAWL